MLFLIYPCVMISCSKVRHFELSRFISPDVCGGCHSAIHEQWKSSMHNLSQSDTIYRLAAFAGLQGLTDSGEIAEAEHCVTCHNPMGFVTGFPKRVSDEKEESKIPAVTREGIQCDFCHSATGAYAIYNAKIKLDPGNGEQDPGTKRGPFADSKVDYHKTEFSKFHTESEICGVCHDVRHVTFGTKLETTYEEWAKSPYNATDSAKRIVCQGCHMYQRPGVPATGSTPRPENPGTAQKAGRRGRISLRTSLWVPTALSRLERRYREGEDGGGAPHRAAELSIDERGAQTRTCGGNGEKYGRGTQSPHRAYRRAPDVAPGGHPRFGGKGHSLDRTA
jgi:hypothetical protein